MELYIQGIEKLSEKKVLQALFLLNETAKKTIIDQFTEYNIMVSEKVELTFKWDKQLEIDQLFSSDKVVQAYLQNQKNISEEVLAGVGILLWVRCFEHIKLYMHPHHLSLSAYTIDLSGLTVIPDNSTNFEMSKGLIVLLKMLLKANKMEYVNPIKQVPFTIKTNLQISSYQPGTYGVLCVVETNSEQPSHEIEHIDKDMVLLQANIDDMNPEIIPYVMDRLFANGANDVFYQPIIMKKGRNATMITVLCRVERINSMEDILFQETTTIGVRRVPTAVHRLRRYIKKIETPWGNIDVKVAEKNGTITQLSPEFEDCKKLAIQNGVPLKTIYQAVNAAIKTQIM